MGVWSFRVQGVKGQRYRVKMVRAEALSCGHSAAGRWRMHACMHEGRRACSRQECGQEGM